MTASPARRVVERLGLTVATCGPLGYAPIAPGTVGSLGGLFVYFVIRGFGSPRIEAIAIVAVFGVGTWSAGIAERHFGRIDPGMVVIDEVLGMLVTLAFIPVSFGGAIAAFFLFRALDIIKPWPARQFERLSAGWGIMADDAMSAVYGNLILRGAVLLMPGGLT